MKGYQVKDRLYIFPQTVDVIPEVEGVDVIYVQHETVKAWKEANSAVADKIKGYNFFTMTALPKEWAGHTDDDIEPEPEPKADPELAWSSDSATVTIGADDNIFPTLSNPHDVTVDYNSSDGEKATIDASTGEITLLAEGETTISAAFVGDDTYEAQTVDYTLTVEAAEPETHSLEVTDALEAILQVWDNDAGADVDPAAVPVGHSIQVNLNGDFTLNKEATEGTIVTISLNDVDISDSHNADEFHYVAFEMPDEDSSLVVEEWIPEVETYTLTLEGTYSDGGQMVVTIDGDQAEGESPYTVPEGATVNFQNTQGTDGDFEWDPQLTDEGGYHYIVMPAEDVTITINYTGGGSGPS